MKSVIHSQSRRFKKRNTVDLHAQSIRMVSKTWCDFSNFGSLSINNDWLKESCPKMKEKLV